MLKRIVGRTIEDLAVLLLKTLCVTAVAAVIVGGSIYAIFSEDFQLAVKTNLMALSKHSAVQTSSTSKSPEQPLPPQLPPAQQQPQSPFATAPAAPVPKGVSKKKTPQPGPIQKFVDAVDVFLGLKPRPR